MAPIMTKKLRILIIILALLLAVSAFATTAIADSGDGSITVSTTDINTTSDAMPWLPHTRTPLNKFYNGEKLR